MKKPIAQAVYLQIADDLRTRIRSDYWSPGSMLPSRADLAHEYGVALMTVQKAIQPLLDEGLLIASHRRGTFVAQSAHEILDVDPTIDAGVPDVDQLEALRVGIIGSFHIDMSDMNNWENLDSWLSRMLRGFSNEIARLGGRAEVHNLHGHSESEDAPILACVRQALDREAQGLVFVDIRSEKDYGNRIPPLMEAFDIPYVVVSASTVQGPAPCVCTNERQAGKAAVRHLIEAGYQRIVAMPLYDLHWEHQRFAGAKQEAGSALVLPAPEDIDLLRSAYDSQWNPIRPERARIHAEILDRTVNFDSLVPELGIQPGRDLGLIGFDDHSYASLLGITSVGQPLTQIGVTAARLLADAVRDGLDSVQAVVRCRVEARASTQRDSPVSQRT
jgi:DNA-binding LacI/PurR family transcriptional regulator/DNA-binding transcriptional regulator YhcF (GntR family)